MRVVPDTNVLISALIRPGEPRDLIFKIVRKGARVITSREILDEFLGVTDTPRIRKYVDDDDVVAFLRIIGYIADVIDVQSEFEVIEEDPSDDIVLRVAYDGKAEYIVSGDGHLLSLEEYKGIKIVTINRMLKVLKDIT